MRDVQASLPPRRALRRRRQPDDAAGAGAVAAALPAQLEARPGKARLSGGGETSILGFDGTTPGPVLRYRQGDELAVRFLNKLDRPATIHWHGLRGDNAMEGVAPLTQAPVAPRGILRLSPQARRARTFLLPAERLWRDAGARRARPQGTAPRRRAGAAAKPTPTCFSSSTTGGSMTPGEVIGGFDDPAAARGVGRIGSLLCVNGTAAPAAQSVAPGARVRLRLANLSNARIMVLSVVGAQPFVIAIDGQPCDAFEPIKRSIPVAPGARFELMFDMPETEGAKASLVLRGPNGEDRDLFVADAKGAKARSVRRSRRSRRIRRFLPRSGLESAKKVDLVIEPRKGGSRPRLDDQWRSDESL